MSRSFAVVGSGPSGFYAIEALIQKVPDCRIDLIERLPAPFGLVRYGVAPDHEKTRNITRAYIRAFDKADVRFYGNVEVGRDLDLDDLRGAYDAVILATGASRDRKLSIPGVDLPGVYGAAAFVAWYNGHPDWRDLAPDLGCERAAVIGNGNVALDVARILARSVDELAATDIAPYALEALAESRIREIYIFGRRGPVEASFTKSELAEMGELERAVALVRPEQLPDSLPPFEDSGMADHRVYNMKKANLEILRSFAANREGDKPIRIHFEFFAAPREIRGDARVESLCMERTRLEEGRAVGTGETFDVDVGAVIAAIGYRSLPVPGAPFDDARGIIPNADGHVEGNLFVVGWVKRGPTGTIPTNRDDSFAVVDQVVARLEQADDGERPGRAWLEGALAACGARPVSYQDWERIRDAETAAATPPAPRRKFTCVEDMLAVLDRS